MIIEKKFKTTRLKILISTKTDGDMNTFVPDERLKNFLSSNNFASMNMSDMEQEHGIVIEKAVKGKRSIGDGIITQDAGHPLVIRSADCLPVVLFDPNNIILMSLHCGYKGIQNGIVINAVKMLKDMGSDIGNTFVFMGPCICRNCYSVSRQRAAEFKKIFPESVLKKNSTFYVDLRNAATQALITHGIIASNVKQLDRCTKEDNRFFSYRGQDKNERFATVAQIDYV